MSHPPLTDREFDSLSWHDCHIWGIAIRAGDAEVADWRSEIVIDLDFIVEWRCSLDGTASFLVAPAELVFTGATGLSISLPSPSHEAFTAVHPLSIAAILREHLPDAPVYLDRRFYRWTIELNWPADGRLEFGAEGFTQRFLSEPRELNRQHLLLSERESMLRRAP